MSADPPQDTSLAERVAGRLARGKQVSLSPPPPALAAAPEAIAEVRKASVGGAFLDINFARLQAGGFITPQSPRSPHTEAIRGIKRQILRNAFPHDRKGGAGGGNHDNVIMVTSSMPGEGKTFTSLNLAISLCAEHDLFVLLIDGDGHRRFLGDLLGASEGAGLVDILADKNLQIGDLIQRTSIPNLSFVSGGRSHPHSAELLASKQFGLLMQDLAARYPDRIIIIDTPPVLVSTEALVLSGYVGQILVIVEKDRTSIRQLQRTLDMLEGGRNIGCVLNMAPEEDNFSGYGY